MNDMLETFRKIVTLMPKRTTAPCEVHKDHTPLPTYQEIHHIIPRAWQAFWQPEVAPYPGKYDGQEMWDSRTVNVCRTGHGNIHFWIVALMHAWDPSLSLDDVATKVRVAYADHVGRSDFMWALQALDRFEQSGGDLGALVQAHLWGGI